MFSFNNPYGACPGCSGLGYQLKVDPDLIMPNRSLSIMEGGIIASGWGNAKNDTISRMYYEALGRKYRFTLDTPLEKLSDAAIDALLYGTKGEKLKLQYDRGNGRGTLEQAFEGIVNNLSRRRTELHPGGNPVLPEPGIRRQPRQNDCGPHRLRQAHQTGLRGN